MSQVSLEPASATGTDLAATVAVLDRLARAQLMMIANLPLAALDAAGDDDDE